MQYLSSRIILHRPTAGFGSSKSRLGASSRVSRQNCLDNAIYIASALRDYRNTYGDATTLSGVGLHSIATASTILIADVAERRSTDATMQTMALKTCVVALSELEKTYKVARRVRRIIQLVMGLCHLDIDNIDGQAHIEPNSQQSSGLAGTGDDLENVPDAAQFLNNGGDLANISWSDFDLLFADSSLPGPAQHLDMIYSIDH
jgi:hypothetical protein